MKIKGEYILSRRSIARMIATITAALMTLYAAATAQAESIVRRIHDATIALHSLDRQMLGNTARTVVPEFMYREYKALYLELRAGDTTGRTLGQRTSCPLLWRRIRGLSNGRDVRCPSRGKRNGQDVRCPSGRRFHRNRPTGGGRASARPPSRRKLHANLPSVFSCRP